MSLSSSDQNPQPAFGTLGLSGPLLEAIQRAGYSTATAIQARTIPLLLEGRDVLGQAQTGTGKTAAFALPMLERIDLEQKRPQVLVLTPTRELAIQVADAFRRYAAGLPGLRVVPIYGGQDYHIQFRQLDRGAHVVVGTPGRVMDHMNRGSLKLDGLRGLVLDEADEMLRMGFAEDVEWVLSRAPAQRQIALFSATIPDSIRRIAQRHLRNPAEITIKEKGATPEAVRQRFVVVSPHQKKDVLARVLESESIDAVLVFVNTKGSTEAIADYLCLQGHRAAALSGDVPQSGRERIVENLRSGKLDVIIATDVAARGLDVQRISHVINYDVPLDAESYVHRIGRTGRATRVGDAILLLHPRARGMLRRIEEATRQKIEQMDIPTKDDINQRRVARFHERITKGLAHPDLEVFSSLVEQYRLLNDVSMERIAAVLAALAAGDAPLLIKEDLHEADFAETRDNGGGSRPQSKGRAFERHGRVRLNGAGERGQFEGSEPERMETFRIEVGHVHKVKPTNIVGAIANETGLASQYIGRIEIFEDYSTVDMRVGMPAQMFQMLKDVKVSGRRLDISRVDWSPVPEVLPVRVKPEAAEPLAAPIHKKHKPKSGENRQVGRTFKPKSKFGVNRSVGKKFGARFKPKRSGAKS